VTLPLEDGCASLEPGRVDPLWQSQTVLGLARTIRDEGDFEKMGVLGDALEDAGCDNPRLLTHCRWPGSHVEGCWVLDLVLSAQGKADGSLVVDQSPHAAGPSPIRSYWKFLARSIACGVNEEMFQCHQGVFALRESGLLRDVLVIFGNDSFRKDRRTRVEVELMRGQLGRLHLKELAFDVDPKDGCTWVLLVSRATSSLQTIENDFEFLSRVDDVVHQAWHSACDLVDSETM
jgi:hypothetical protein